MNNTNLIQPVLEIARRAGQAILEIYQGQIDVIEKDDKSPLTDADLASHRCILAGLAELTPDIPVLSEESAKIPFEERAAWNPYWLVDPLDGTKEFIKRNGEFTVNIALIEDHRPTLGVVHVPVSGVDYYGCEGVGAFRQEAGGPPRAIRVSDGAEKVRVVGSRSHRGASLDAFLDNLGDHEMVPMGSSLKFCVVAEGGAEIYPRLGPTSEWDTAAAHAVVESAGGTVVDLHGEPLRYNAKSDILNPYFLVIGDRSRNWHAFLEA